MATSKKPRKKYRPKPVLRNPLGYVLESLTPVREHDPDVMTLRIRHSQAMVALLQGRARKPDMDTLIAMCNMTEALHEMGYGVDCDGVCEAGKQAIASIAQRATKHGRFTPSGPEVASLNTLLELHDAQMDILTVRDMERAINRINTRLRTGKDTVLLPTAPEHLL